jgi:hypothetical protein
VLLSVSALLRAGALLSFGLSAALLLHARTAERGGATQVRSLWCARELLPRVTVLALVLLAAALLALRHDDAAVDGARELEVSPLPTALAACSVQGPQALAHAQRLEQVARLRWERVPLSPSEAPRAVTQLAEAEVCFSAARDRTGHTRVGSTRRAYEAELVQRFARARLLLRMATREPGTVARHERADAARSRSAERQLTTLLALLEQAPPSAWAYRDQLVQLSHRYTAEAQARADARESHR